MKRRIYLGITEILADDYYLYIGIPEEYKGISQSKIKEIIMFKIIGMINVKNLL